MSILRVRSRATFRIRKVSRSKSFFRIWEPIRLALYLYEYKSKALFSIYFFFFFFLMKEGSSVSKLTSCSRLVAVTALLFLKLVAQKTVLKLIISKCSHLFYVLYLTPKNVYEYDTFYRYYITLCYNCSYKYDINFNHVESWNTVDWLLNSK